MLEALTEWKSPDCLALHRLVVCMIDLMDFEYLERKLEFVEVLLDVVVEMEAFQALEVFASEEEALADSALAALEVHS